MTKGPGRPPEYSLEVRRRALEMIATGRSARDVARELEIPGRTIARWARAAKPATIRRPKDEAEAPDGALGIPDGDPFDGVDMSDSLAVTIAQRNSFLSMARRAEESGNFTAAASASRAAALLAPTIKAIEKQRGEEGDWIKIRRADVAQRIAGLREKIATLAARGMLCAECSRKLSISWGEVSEPSEKGSK